MMMDYFIWQTEHHLHVQILAVLVSFSSAYYSLCHLSTQIKITHNSNLQIKLLTKVFHLGQIWKFWEQNPNLKNEHIHLTT